MNKTNKILLFLSWLAFRCTLEDIKWNFWRQSEKVNCFIFLFFISSHSISIVCEKTQSLWRRNGILWQKYSICIFTSITFSCEWEREENLKQRKQKRMFWGSFAFSVVFFAFFLLFQFILHIIFILVWFFVALLFMLDGAVRGNFLFIRKS